MSKGLSTRYIKTGPLSRASQNAFRVQMDRTECVGVGTTPEKMRENGFRGVCYKHYFLERCPDPEQES